MNEWEAKEWRKAGPNLAPTDSSRSPGAFNCPECAACEDRLYSLSDSSDLVKSLACSSCGYWWTVERNLAGDWVPAG